MSIYSPLTDFLKSLPTSQNKISITFSKLEEILGCNLPSSAQIHRPWWGNEKNPKRSQAKAWMAAGWEVDSVDLAGLVVVFRRGSGKNMALLETPTPQSKEITMMTHQRSKTLQKFQGSSAGKGRRIVLVSCGKRKADCPTPAKDLYTSDLFQKASTYAKTIGDSWYIISAKYGLLAPDQVIAPYEMTIKNMPTVERKAWAADVLESLMDIVGSNDEIIFMAEIRYRENLIGPLEKWGCKVSIPMEGLPFGKQLSWLNEQLEY